MQLPKEQFLRARRIFEKIYRNDKISVRASVDTLKEQLNLYLDHLGSHTGKKISEDERKRIFAIVDRNNEVAKILASKDFKEITQKNRNLLGPVALSVVFCIDGRIPAIFLGGRFSTHWEEPAGEITASFRKSDGNLIPESSELCESMRNMTFSGRDILEVIFAHTSFLGHGCGAMAAKKKAGLIDPKASPEDANIKIINEKSIPALTNIYNEFRNQKGLAELKRVGICALYDTDTFGILLNYDKKDKGLLFSTTELTNEFRNEMDDFFIKENLVFGSFKETFSELKHLTKFLENVYLITSKLLSLEGFRLLRQTIENYIKKNYPELTLNQKNALRFLLIYTISFQYLTGSSATSKDNYYHPFVHHEEEYMAVSTRGTVIGKFDPQDQGFASTPSDAGTAVSNIKTKISIMAGAKENKSKPYILFICNPIALRDLAENSNLLHKTMDASAELLRKINDDKDLGNMIEEGKIIPVPILLAADNRAVLKIIDHSAYI
ncbi:MAG TPA: hypothetical protein VJG66_00605 [Patescibacteria group bacterium]|nr:hypothetical protein [Patescibacteria group bacterium]